ncbi:hypothetical protein FKM82_009937 [Ascaphus truei]
MTVLEEAAAHGHAAAGSFTNEGVLGKRPYADCSPIHGNGAKLFSSVCRAAAQHILWEILGFYQWILRKYTMNHACKSSGEGLGYIQANVRQVISG